jgi:hypothetical protein
MFIECKKEIIYIYYTLLLQLFMDQIEQNSESNK